MTRKLITFNNPETQERLRVYYQNGECKNPNVLQQVVDHPGMVWESIKTSGMTFVEASRQRVKSRKLNPNIQEMLGLQVAERVTAAQPEVDAEGHAVVKHRGKKSSITPENITKIKVLAEAGKTLKQAEAETGIPYATLIYTAKKEGIVFVKGKKGNTRKAKTADPAMLEEMAKLALFMTIKQAAESLNVAVPTLYLMAKKAGIKFVAGKKGRQGSGIVKPLDPVLVENVKRCASEGKTVSQTTKELNVEWFQIVKIAKQEKLEFVKGKRGRAKKEVTVPIAA